MSLRVSFLGVPLTLRPSALGSGLLSALVVALMTRERRGLQGAAAGLLWYSADGAHVAGHILSSQVAGAPMDGIDFGLYPKSVYHSDDIAPQQHIGRAIGGPLGSLAAALALAGLARAQGPGLARQLLAISAAQHGLLFVLSMAPLPIVDGGVIYANLLRLRRPDSQGLAPDA